MNREIKFRVCYLNQVGNEDFGNFAWSFSNLEMANNKFDWLIKTDFFNRNKK